jgi:hypothetical protein
VHSDAQRTESTWILSKRSEQARLRAEFDEFTQQYVLHSEAWRKLQIRKIHLLNERTKGEQSSDLQRLYNEEKYISHALTSCAEQQEQAYDQIRASESECDLARGEISDTLSEESAAVSPVKARKRRNSPSIKKTRPPIERFAQSGTHEWQDHWLTLKKD